MSPRTGRPKLDKPLKNDIKVRLNDDLHNRLVKYCEEKEISKAEVIRKAVVKYLENEE